MACFVLHPRDWEVTIPDVTVENGVTIYNIKIRIGEVAWTVTHRYKDFNELHESLVTDHCLSKDILPPKKVIGNRDPNFVEQRRIALQHYLTYIVDFLQKTMPKKLVSFLQLEKYDIMFLLQDMSYQFLNYENCMSLENRCFEFNILQVHAISERLKLPCPPLEMFGLKYDFSNVLEFCANLETVTINGNSNLHESNIVARNLHFEFSAFKSLKKLVLQNLSLDSLCKASDLRLKLETLYIFKCGVKNIYEALLCDELHKDWESTCDGKIWKSLTEIDFSFNEIELLDGGMMLMPFVTSLNANSNKIIQLTNLNLLPKLQQLHLSCNRIHQLTDLSSQLKFINFIDLSQNQISSLKGFENLASLHGLNIASNVVIDIEEIMYISNLPELEYVVLTGNPLSTVVDYRIKVLERFGARYNKIWLDNEQSTEKELDTVAVLQALRYVKEGNVPFFMKCGTSSTNSNE